MKTSFFIIASAGLLGISQTSFFPNLNILGVRPDLVLLATITVGLVWSLRYSLLLAIAGGLVLDLSGSGTVGLSSIALLPVAVLTSLEALEVVESRLPAMLILTILGTVLYYLVLMLLFQATSATLPWLDLLVSMLPLTVLINSMASLPMLGLFWLFSERFQPDAGRAA